MRLSSGLFIIGLALSATARAQTVRGTVVDDGGRPVSGVVVLLEDAASREVARILSGDGGAYRVAAPGPGTLRARSLYITTLTFDRTLEPLSQRIGAQRVDIHGEYARQPWRPLDADTLRRRGYVYSEGEVRTYNAPDLDVLLSIYYVPDQGEQSRGMPVGCYSRVYLDNQLLNPGTPTPAFNLREIPPTQVEAMELYAGATQVPTEFLSRNSSCGVLVIHLRRPR